MMNVREAILKAADSIEMHPELFDFRSTSMPNECGTPGCAIGWIALHADEDLCGQIMADKWMSHKTELFMGVESGDFYDRMDALAGDFRAWAHNPKGCAKTLRLYADEYHPIEYDGHEKTSWNRSVWIPAKLSEDVA